MLLTTNFKKFESSEGNVWKYVFATEEKIAETVLYQYKNKESQEAYPERVVICCSVQSGCPVGCTFCGTGKKFIKNLTTEEIVSQIKTVLKDSGLEDANSKTERFQIMFMSMGEPMLNWDNVEKAIEELHELYPNAQLLLSTIGVNDDAVFKRIVALSKRIDKVGLQFSIHKSNEEDRNDLIPFKKKYSLREIRDRGMYWNFETGRPVYLNYCIDGTNNTEEDIERLKTLFSPFSFYFTFSVICDSDAVNGNMHFQDLNVIQGTMNSFIEDGYNVRMFNPEGQDNIGAGCGQLWFVQEWLKNKKKDLNEFF